MSSRTDYDSSVGQADGIGPGAPAIEVHDMTVAYGTQPVLWDIDLSLPANRLIAVVGPNGAGKSTLLKAILTLVKPLTGWVKVFGAPYVSRRSWVGYVPQRETVDWDFPTTALDVVTMGLYGQLGWFRRPGRQHRMTALECLDRVGMKDYADRQINQLSGGQQQRVFLARALAQDSRLYLMDEPFAGVDAATEDAVLTLLKNLRNDGRTVIAVHHDLQTVAQYFDYVVLLNMRLVAAGPIATTFTEENIQKAYGGRLTALSKAAEALLAKRPDRPAGKKKRRGKRRLPQPDRQEERTNAEDAETRREEKNKRRGRRGRRDAQRREE